MAEPPDVPMKRPRLSDEERSERQRQHRRAHHARKKAAELDGTTPDDRRRHMFADPGEPIAESDWRPRAVRTDPESILAAAFNAARCDYGGPIAADTVIRTVLHDADRLMADASAGKRPRSAQVDAGQEGVC